MSILRPFRTSKSGSEAPIRNSDQLGKPQTGAEYCRTYSPRCSCSQIPVRPRAPGSHILHQVLDLVCTLIGCFSAPLGASLCVRCRRSIQSKLSHNDTMYICSRQRGHHAELISQGHDKICFSQLGPLGQTLHTRHTQATSGLEPGAHLRTNALWVVGLCSNECKESVPSNISATTVAL
jgi:hypothetical protein